MDAIVDRALAAAIAELERQGRASGDTTMTDGRSVQIDGSFEIRPLVEAILRAAADPVTASATCRGRDPRSGHVQPARSRWD